jgi:hypothetical protein
VLLRGREEVQLELALSTPEASRLHEAWDAAAERKKAGTAISLSMASSLTR